MRTYRVVGSSMGNNRVLINQLMCGVTATRLLEGTHRSLATRLTPISPYDAYRSLTSCADPYPHPGYTSTKPLYDPGSAGYAY